MKKIMVYAALIAVIALASCAGSREATKDEMNHEFILSLPGVHKQQAFDKTLKWIANTFRSAKAVIEY
ncbi:MAG: hypothetical protein NTZ35_08045 [Ignavibacteriales bacterium]|nr:hypothetical protein [Ignavibacteriales bacterium]